MALPPGKPAMPLPLVCQALCPLPSPVQEPIRAAQLLSEHAGYPAAIARLLDATAAAEGGEGARLPSGGLRLLARLAAAAGTPAELAATWRLLRGASLAAELPRLRADLALRLACQLAGLHPLTALPLPPEEAAAAAAAPARSAAAEAAAGMLASLACDSDGEEAAPGSPLAGLAALPVHLQLAARLARFAADVYREAEAPLLELRCLAVLAAAGAPPPPPAALLPGLGLAEAALARCATLATSSPAMLRRRPASREEHAAVKQAEEAFHLGGLADSGGGGGGRDVVTAPRFDPGLPALAQLFNAAAKEHGAEGLVRVSVRRAQQAQRGLAAAAAEVQVAERRGVQDAAAFYLFRLAREAALGHLARLAGTAAAAGAAAAAAAAAPPGLRVRGGAAELAEAALRALGEQLAAAERVQRLTQAAKRLFPRLRAGGAALAGGAGLAEIDTQLAGAVLKAVFPSGEPRLSFVTSMTCCRLVRLALSGRFQPPLAALNRHSHHLCSPDQGPFPLPVLTPPPHPPPPPTLPHTHTHTRLPNRPRGLASRRAERPPPAARWPHARGGRASGPLLGCGCLRRLPRRPRRLLRPLALPALPSGQGSDLGAAAEACGAGAGVFAAGGWCWFGDEGADGRGRRLCGRVWLRFMLSWVRYCEQQGGKTKASLGGWQLFRVWQHIHASTHIHMAGNPLH
jgi:hypothetical protein